MSAATRWVSKKALLLLHEESLAAFGGGRGFLDEGLLDSALARPLNALAYKPSSTIAELAAGYGFGIAKNHALVDGNKRLAFLSVGLFLAINRYRLQADQVEAIEIMLAVAGGELDEKGFAAWIAKNSRPVRRSPKKKSGRGIAK